MSMVTRCLLLLLAVVYLLDTSANGQEPCLEVTDDGMFSNIRYSTVKDDDQVSHGTRVTVTCAEGMVPVSPRATCNKGRWIPSEPVCDLPQCTAPDLPARIRTQRGSLRPGFGKVYHNTRAIAGCSSGYVHVEPGDKSYKRVLCVNGSWNRNTDCVSEPCYFNRTTDISDIDGAEDQNNGLYKVAGGENVTIQCRSGRRVSAVCEGATFKPTSPSCSVRQHQGCQPPNIPLGYAKDLGTERNITEPVNHDTHARVFCHQGLSLSDLDNSIAVCQEGAWNISILECIPDSCEIPELTRGQYLAGETPGDRRMNGSAIFYQCGDQDIISKCVRGRWVPPVDGCLPGTRTNTVTSGSSTTTAAPNIPVDRSSLHLITKPHNVSDGLGALVVLECSASDPDAEIFWYHNDVPLTTNGHPEHVTIYTGHHEGEVTIDGLTEEDAGEYICEAETDDDITSAAAYVHVEIPECNIDFINGATDKRVHAGTKRVYFSCSARNARRIDWYKEDTLIRNRPGKYRIILSGRLKIQNICLGDMGKYRCVAHKNDNTCRSERHMVLTVWQACGQPVIAVGLPAQRGRIVGGNTATVGSAPWMAQVIETGAGFYCAGTLIARRWILTAAVCITEFSAARGRPLLIQNLQIKLGKYSRLAEEDHERNYTVERIISHENFIGSTYDNDIALLQLDTDVEYTDYIKPICFVPADFHDRHFLNGRQLGTVTGWGALAENGPAATNLEEVQLPLQNHSTCAGSTTHSVTDNMFCAGYAQQIIGDACRGDNGGPFIMEHGGKWYQVGIISWGEGCARLGQYGFYTKLANFYSWIMGKIGEHCA